MIPDKGYASKQRKANWNKDPIGKFVPVFVLDIVERLLINQFPRSENVYLMCPDCANVVEAKGKIEKKKQFWIHGVRVDYQLLVGNKRSFAWITLFLRMC